MSGRMSQGLAAAGVVAVALSLSSCSTVPTAEVGECVDIADLEGELTEIPTVDCSEEHDGEVIHSFELPDGDFPGDEAILEAVEEGCVGEAFESYVGLDWESSELQMTDISPNQTTWDEADDREVLCIAYLDGSTTTESFEGAGI